MSMNLHHLAIFHSIATTGSISASAQRLHISQPALSHELKNLESRLGVVLFDRLPRGMRLTQAGSILHSYSSRLFHISETAESAMRQIADAQQGHLTLGASNTIGTYMLPQLLSTFRQANPGIQISLFIGNTEQVAQGVADLRFAIGFIEGPLHIDGLIARQFRYDELLPVISAKHSLSKQKFLSAQDIAGLPLLIREVGSGTRELIMNTLSLNNIEPSNVMEFSNTEAIRQAVLHEGGIAWLPQISITQDLENKDLIVLPIKELIIHRPLNIIHRSKSYIIPATEMLLELLSAS